MYGWNKEAMANIDIAELALRPARIGEPTQCYVDRVSVTKGIYKMYLESHAVGLPPPFLYSRTSRQWGHTQARFVSRLVEPVLFACIG